MTNTTNTSTNGGLVVRAQNYVAGIDVLSVVVEDTYNTGVHRNFRRIVRAYTKFLDWYLHRHPDLAFNDPGNWARKLSYIPKGMKAWSQYMPGAFATYYAHSPEHKKMHDGKALDSITRHFFRHSYDAVGLRSRAAVATYLAANFADRYRRGIRWVSIGGGTGQPLYDAFSSLPDHYVEGSEAYIYDIDPVIVSFAKEMYESSGLCLRRCEWELIDAFSDKLIERLRAIRPDIVDAMGVFEYWDDEQVVGILRRIYAELPKGSVLVFSNMFDERPELEVHRRAVGWPGVIPRSIADIARLLSVAAIPLSKCQAYLSQDKVYIVYRIERA